MTDERIKEALKPCPFCGGEGEVFQGRYLHENWAQCKKCHTQLGGTFTSPINALKAWNTRTAERLAKKEMRECLLKISQYPIAFVCEEARIIARKAWKKSKEYAE